MRNKVCNGKHGKLGLVEVALLHIQLLGKQANNNAREGRGDDPAPPRNATPGQVNQGMADEADQSAGYRTVHGCQQAQNGVLQADVGVGHRAGNRHKTAQNKEESCADANCNEGFDVVIVFHDSALLL